MFVAVLFIALGAVVTPLANSIAVSPVIKIDSGELRGYIAEVNNTGGARVRGYLGIPFAQAERFQPPEPPKTWNSVKNMMSMGKVCPQAIGGLGASKPEDISEDCLNLNVFVPDDANSSSLLPVMVWIHGGGFIIGSNRVYDGSYIATLGKVVVVAINYRVTVFGFLTNGKGGDLKGNYGLLDQVEALKWVKRNIAKFNGDPNKVTIFGESAGGASVSMLMLSKLTKGLFLRAIPQSGDATAFWAAGTYESLSKSIKVFSKNVGCSEDISKLRECLKPKDTMVIINSSLTVPWPNFIPVVDDKNFFNDLPSVLYDKLDFEKRDVMMGVTDDEGTVFTNAVGDMGAGLNVTHGVSRETFVNVLKGGGLAMVIPDPKSDLINATICRYTDWADVSSPIRNRRMYVDLTGDNGFVAPAMRGAKAYSLKKATTYFYSFEHRYGKSLMGQKIPPWVRAYHGADIAFVFGSPLMNATVSRDINFTRAIIKIWTNFAKTGNPNSPDSLSVAWPEYTLDQQKYMSLKPNMTVNSHLRADYVAYWNWFIPNALRAAHKPCKCKPCGSVEDTKPAVAVVLLLSTLVTTWFL